MATANYFRFIPRLPTEEAWKQRLIEGSSSLKGLVTQLYELVKHRPSLKFDLRGVIIFREKRLDMNLEKMTEFSGVTDLENILMAINWNADIIQRISFYKHGYLMVATAF